MDSKNSVQSTKKKTKKVITLAQAEEQHLLSVSSTATKKSSESKTLTNISNMKSDEQVNKTQTIKSTTSVKKEIVESETNNDSNENPENVHEDQLEDFKQNSDHKNDGDGDNLKKINSKKKIKAKKNKKVETEQQNISVKSSFSKFDALQKRNLIHVRSIDASTAQEKFSNPQGEMQRNCRLCDKAVYKMEEIKAEKSIYHKNCFRCNECNKQLKVDTYQSHEGVLYCTVHFKLLFAPKSVEDDESVQPRKPELIIRENQPTELPPDVVRASDKPDLGLEELQQLNVRSRFQVFEQSKGNTNEDQQQDLNKCNNNVVRRSASILSKVAKLQQLGSSANSQQDSSASSDNDEDYDDIDFDSTSENPNADLIRQKKREHKRERPVGIGEAMNDIRSLFEKGHGIRKEERREERKQEIQNIRSRLFMGKQARIKEMYQQAVAESEHASDKKPEIDIEVDSKSLRERFEKGDVFKDNQSNNENDGESCRKGAIEKEADVFESAISKKSRSIFMELDANVVTSKNQNIMPSQSSNKILQHQKSLSSIGSQVKSGEIDDVVKCDEAVDDVEIKTSEISEKFKFFEKYHPTENKKRAFRITPPREGVVKMPSPDENSNEDENSKELSPDRNIIVHSRTTSMMLNKFRELEKNPNRCENNSPKPLKCFTPPPDGNRRLYVEQDSDEYDSNDEEEEDDDEEEEEEDESELEDDDYNNNSHLPKDDEALREAQNAARAKQLRLKFEKWQANEIKREKNDELIHNIYANNASDESSIESTQAIRERFEKMRNAEKQSQPTRPRYQVKRFV